MDPQEQPYIPVPVDALPAASPTVAHATEVHAGSAGGVVSTIAEVEAVAAGVTHAGVVAAGLDASGGKQARPSRQGKQVPRWTPDEEEKLRILVGDGEPRGKWSEIAAQMGPERSAMAVEQHWCAPPLARRRPSLF